MEGGEKKGEGEKGGKLEREGKRVEKEKRGEKERILISLAAELELNIETSEIG